MSAKDETQHALAHYSAMADEATAQVAALAKSVEAHLSANHLVFEDGMVDCIVDEVAASVAAWAFAHGAEVKA
jgi:hypothetical protein